MLSARELEYQGRLEVGPVTFLPGHGKGRAEAKREQLQTVEVDDSNGVEIAIFDP